MVLDTDLMVAVDVSRTSILDGDEQRMPSPRLSYWQDIVPHQVPEAGYGEHLVVVHTADHPGRMPAFKVSRAEGMGRSQSSHPAPTNGNAFCGWDKPVSMIRLELSPEYLRRANAAIGSAPSQLQAAMVLHTRDPRVVQTGAWLLDEMQRGNTGPQLYTESLANVLALHLLRQYGAAAAMRDYPGTAWPLSRQVASAEVARAIEYMDTYLSRPISLAELSRATHVSPSHLARLFKRSTGLAPHQFLIRLRVERAKELLLSDWLGISEVAVQTGFADQSHLNRHLRRVYGVTPKAIAGRK